MTTVKADKPAQDKREAILRLVHKPAPEVVGTWDVYNSEHYGRRVIGCILQASIVDRDNRVYFRIADSLQPADFYIRWQGFVYYVIQQLANQDKLLEPANMAVELQKLPEYQSHTLAELEEKIGADFHTIHALPEQVEEYAQMVLVDAVRLRVANATQEIVRLTLDKGLSLDEMTSRAAGLLTDATRVKPRKQSDMTSIASRWLDHIERGMAGEITGAVPTGFDEIDEITGGLGAGEVTILAGHSGMGKTTLMLDMVRNLAKQGKSVLVVSLEMSEVEIMNKLAKQELGLNTMALRNFRLSQSDLSGIIQWSQTLDKWRVTIDDTYTKGITPLQLRALIRRHQELGAADVVFVDGLWLMHADNPIDTNADFRYICDSIVGDARELSVPLVMLHQYNQDSKTRQNKKPLLTDLAGGTAIQRNVQNVWALWRRDDVPQLTDLHFLKGRNVLSSGKSISLSWDNARTSYTPSQFVDTSRLDW